MRRVLLLAIVFLLSLSPGRDMRSCGPERPEPTYVFLAHPEPPLEEFAAGKLSILQQTYARSYLFVAYRYLSGIGFDTAEQAQVVQLWRSLNNGRNWFSPSDSDYQIWDSLTQRLAPLHLDDPDNKGEDFQFWWRRDRYKYDVSASAFHAGWTTLLQRIKAFGVASDEVRNWLIGERLVLMGFADWERMLDITVHSRSSVIDQDRSYLAASSRFHSERDPDFAIRSFGAIAADNSSPWQATSAYMIARCYLQKAYSHSVWSRDTADTLEIRKAKDQLQKVISDPRSAEMHSASKQLLRYVDGKLEPERMLHEAAHALNEPHSASTIFQTLSDYRLLLNRFVDIGEFAWRKELIQYDSLPKLRDFDELTDWIRTFQSNDQSGKHHALSELKQKKNLLWLACVLPKLSGNEPEAPTLIERALAVPDTMPWFDHLHYHAIRLMIERGELNKARNLLSLRLLQSGVLLIPPLTIGARNQYLGLRMRIDGTLSDFLSDAPRELVSYDVDDFSASPPEEIADSVRAKQPLLRASFDEDAVRVFNMQLPLETYYVVAQSAELPKHLRIRVALAGWTRAVLLRKEKEAVQLAEDAEYLDPALAPQLSRYVLARSGSEREYAAIDILLHHPSMQPLVDSALGREWHSRESPDHWDENWWRSMAPPRNQEYLGGWDYEREARLYLQPVQPVPFITVEMKQVAAEELKQLGSISTAPNYLIEALLKWAAAAPTDPRIPEDLHIAVLGTRYGSVDSATLGYSRRAWTLLHKRYKNSVWAKRTPHYFSGN